MNIMNVLRAKGFKFPRSVYVILLANPFDKEPFIHEYLEREKDAL